MTAETLSAISGVVLSLLFSYIPGLSKWYGEKSEDVKRLIMLGLIVLAGAAAFGLACGGLAGDFGIGLTCDKAGGIALLKSIAAAAIANQAAYQLTPASRSRMYGRVNR